MSAKQCTTHFHACDCREAKMLAIEKLLNKAIESMELLHSAAVPDEEDEFALIPAASFREFVDAHAALRYELAKLGKHGVVVDSNPIPQPKPQRCDQVTPNDATNRMAATRTQQESTTDE